MRLTPEESLPASADKLSDTKNTSSPTGSRSRRHSRRTAFLLLALLYGVVVVPSAWRETFRREAYLPQLEAEARRHSDDGRLLTLLAARLEQAGEYALAADTFRRALAAGEQDSLLWLHLAADTAAAGDAPRALADLRLGARALPAAPELSQALTRAEALKPGAAPDLVAQAISPQGPDLLLRRCASGSFLNPLIEAWGRRHPETSGFATREHWAASQPENAAVQRLWGLALLSNGRIPEAGAVLQHAVALAPGSSAAHLALAQWLEASGQDTRATVVYMECLRMKPDWLPALLGVGKASLNTGINGYALQSYERATQLAPSSADAWIGLGRAYRKTSVDKDKAVAAFQTAQRLAPDRTDFYTDYADALRQAVQWPAAEALLRKRLQADRGDALAHYLLGMVLLNNTPTPERQAEAETETREALRLFPHSPPADIQLAQIALSKKQVQEAIALLNDALRSNPYNRNAMTVLARAYRQSGQLDTAEKMSKQANVLYEDQQRAQVLESKESKQIMDPGIHEELARLYERTGEPKKATYEQSMAKLLRDNPKKAAEELQQFRSARSAALPEK